MINNGKRIKDKKISHNQGCPKRPWYYQEYP